MIGPRVTARAIVWDQDSSAHWIDQQYGFSIIEEQGDDLPFSASWGEDDAEQFATLEEAKTWCQAQIDVWIAKYAVLPADQPEAQVSGQPMPRVVGVGRMFDNDRAVLVMLARKASDDELRALHQFLRSFGWSPPALEDSIETSEREAVEPGRAISERAALRLIDQLQPGAELDAPHGRDGDGVALVACSRPHCVPHRRGTHCARCD